MLSNFYVCQTWFTSFEEHSSRHVKIDVDRCKISISDTSDEQERHMQVMFKKENRSSKKRIWKLKIIDVQDVANLAFLQMIDSFWRRDTEWKNVSERNCWNYQNMSICRHQIRPSSDWRLLRTICYHIASGRRAADRTSASTLLQQWSRQSPSADVRQRRSLLTLPRAPCQSLLGGWSRERLDLSILSWNISRLLPSSDLRPLQQDRGTTLDRPTPCVDKLPPVRHLLLTASLL